MCWKDAPTLKIFDQLVFIDALAQHKNEANMNRAVCKVMYRSIIDSASANSLKAHQRVLAAKLQAVLLDSTYSY